MSLLPSNRINYVHGCMMVCHCTKTAFDTCIIMIQYYIYVSGSEIVIAKYNNIIIIRLSIYPAALCRHYRFNVTRVIILRFFVILYIYKKNSMYLYHIFVSEICVCSYMCVCCAGARESGKSSTFQSLVDRLVSVMHTMYTCDNRASCCNNNNMCYKHPTGIPT